jgi:predicted house-cleaning noncanonical NTP pyrophosphatase (MazG superfamily)
LKVRERTRFKGRFIAPDSNGAWVVHETNETADWKRSIKKTEWIEEIAWATRRIAEASNMPVVVMWFIDIPSTVSKHKVLPWYHEGWKPHGHAFTAAPRDKRAISEQFVLQTKENWKELQKRISEGEKYSRILVNPIEPEIVRDQEFAKALAKLAKENKLIIELSGGILSHAYYMLSSNGCVVECTDLDQYALEDDQLEFNKLVRDGIPDSIAARGESVEVYRLEHEALIVALRRKLVEEALEVMDAPTTIQITEELADLYEVMNALAETLSITKEDIESAREKKAEKRGTFKKGLMLSKTSLAAPISSAQDDLLSGQSGEAHKTLTLPSDLPSAQKPFHVDKRVDEKGTHGRQFMLSVPVHVDGVEAQRTTFSLETPEKSPHMMLLDAQVERSASDLRIRLTLTNTPKQLELLLLPPSIDGE